MEQHNRGAGRFGELLEIMARLRGNRGCPWDKEQTHVSLKPFLLEEAYELFEAIDADDATLLRDELGDLLFQVVFHCQIAAESGQFDAAEVISDLKEKLIRRHPHVFATPSLTDTESVVKQHARIKAGENKGGPAPSALGNLPRTMPALAQAQRMTERASRVGFDWPSVMPVWQKVHEEVTELQAACSSGDQQRVGEEMGDLLLSLVNLSRFLKIEAEDVLKQATARFSRRFAYIEAALQKAGKPLSESSLQEMDSLWDEAKRQEARGEKSS